MTISGQACVRTDSVPRRALAVSRVTPLDALNLASAVPSRLAGRSTSALCAAAGWSGRVIASASTSSRPATMPSSQ